MKKSNIIVIVFFLVMVFAISAYDIIMPAKERSESENRPLEQMPVLSLKTIFDGSFTRDYETYVTDQFVGRDSWVSLSVSTQSLFGKKEINGVYLANDGYYIEAKKGSDIDADHINENFGHIEDFLEKLPEKYKESTVVTVVPTAALIYADKLPAFCGEYDWNSLLDMAGERFGKFNLDLRPILTEHKEEDIYYRTDHHWTTDGAYYGYVQIAKKLGFEPLDREDFEKKELTNEFLGTTWKKLQVPVNEETIVSYEPKDKSGVKAYFEVDLGKSRDTYNDESKLKGDDEYAYFLGGDQGYVEIVTGIDSDRSLLIIKDSYANCMIPMLSAHYGKIYVADPRGSKYILTRLTQMYEDVTDVLVLYNASTFTSDRNMIWIHK